MEKTAKQMIWGIGLTYIVGTIILFLVPYRFTTAVSIATISGMSCFFVRWHWQNDTWPLNIIKQRLSR